MSHLLDALQFGEYSTWETWHLFTTKLEIDPPKVKTNYISLGGTNGTIDLTEALSERPVYEDRKLLASFWTRRGSRQEREQLLQQITGAIHGRRMKIWVPDYSDGYFMGRIAVKGIVRKNAYTEFSVEAVCDPWRYDNEETVLTYNVDGVQEISLSNTGVAVLCPDITVTGTITFTCNGVTTTASDGSYKVATFKLFEGENLISLSGSGTLTLRYRRATL